MADDDDFGSRWRRWQLSRTSFNWWLIQASAGLALLILGLVGRSPPMIIGGALVAVVGVGVIYSRWRGHKPPT
jgi:hypothetical protein